LLGDLAGADSEVPDVGHGGRDAVPVRVAEIRRYLKDGWRRLLGLADRDTMVWQPDSGTTGIRLRLLTMPGNIPCPSPSGYQYLTTAPDPRPAPKWRAAGARTSLAEANLSIEQVTLTRLQPAVRVTAGGVVCRHTSDGLLFALRENQEGFGVSFDFDGVLARSPFAHGVLYPVLTDVAEARALRARRSVAAALEEVRELAWAEQRSRTAAGDYVEAYDWEGIVRVVANRIGQTFRGSLSRITRDFTNDLTEAGVDSLLYPCVREVLARLKSRDLCLLLLTNGYRDYQLPFLQALGLAGFFDAVFASDDLGSVKPDRSAFETAFRACGHANEPSPPTSPRCCGRNSLGRELFCRTCPTSPPANPTL
jgi:FMN phosphatase YigB (HAD superfamily)